MINYLTTLEEHDAIMEYQMPHLMFNDNSIISKKRIAAYVMKKRGEELLLINPLGFLDECVVAGLTEGQIEFFAKSAPLEYRKSIMELFDSQPELDKVMEVVRAMDEDGGNSSNQSRIKKLIQYIRDNKIAFIN